MQTSDTAVRRTVIRVEDKIAVGADAEVDDKNLIIAPADPALTDPFLALSEDWFSSPGFAWHPHRGLETVTLVLDGVLEYGDNLGNAGALTAGDIQWLTAGRGIIHRELAYRDEHAHTLQLWVNLPSEAKMVDTRYQDLLAAERPVVAHDGVRVDLISGDVDGVSGPAHTHRPTFGALVTVDPNRTHAHGLPAGHRAFCHVLSGAVTIAGQAVRSGQTAWSDPIPGADASVLTIAAADADHPSTVLIYSGQPIGERVVMRGPFVMNSKAEIQQAFRDFHSGRFGDVPHQARLRYR